MSISKIKTLSELFIKCNKTIIKTKYKEPIKYHNEGLNVISHYMKNYYINNESDWYDYITIKNTGYKANELYYDDDTFISMSLISWCPNSFTNIHNHAYMSGIFIPLVGNINQRVYHNFYVHNLLNNKGLNGYCENMVIREGDTYGYNVMSLGHSLSNENNYNICTLHIYDNNLMYLE